MRIQVLQHVSFEGPGRIADWAAARGHTLQRTRLFAGEPLPRLDATDWLVVMGGPMSVNDVKDHPWLDTERQLVREAVESGKAVLGICLGAQLLAAALGSEVNSNPEPEIGWWPVELTRAARDSSLLAGWPDRLEVFHWHGEAFELPAGAVQVARSAACENQGFLYSDRALGLQFHVEITREGIQQLIERCGREIVPARYVQRVHEMLASPDRIQPLHAALCDLLDRLAASDESL